MPSQRKKKSWTLVELLNWTSDYLEQKQIENPRLTAELLLGHVLDLSRVQLYMSFDRPLVETELSAFKVLLKRRLSHEPIQYILGYTEFYSHKIFVGPGVLVPRPETEILVEKVVEYCEKISDLETIKILDIGTGSGNIAVSVAKAVPKAYITAIDVSEQALVIAKKNVDFYGLGNVIDLEQCDVKKKWPADRGGFDIVVSNPPYITDADYTRLPPEIHDFEPQEALRGGQHGLDFYRSLSQIIRPLLAPGGGFFFEIGADQAHSVTSIFEEFDPSIEKDLAGRDRIVTGNDKRITI